MHIDPTDLSANAIYHIITQTLIPRPIAWVLTQNQSGNYNLAPFSYFTGVCSTPPILMLSIGKKPDGTEKDTRVNIKTSKKTVIHIASSAHNEALNDSSASLDYGESELERAELVLATFEGFDLPRLKDCAVAYGCELYEYLEIGHHQQGILFVEVKRLYINDEVVETDGKHLNISAEEIDPLARLGGGEYCKITNRFNLKRPL